jgi:NADPH:quinone reductase-like Zn-dependent oxidoreductase
VRQIQFQQPGRPEDVIFCGQAPEPAVAAADDVLVSIEAFTINPADLLVLQGIYPRNDPSSPTLGSEAIGTVEAAGAAVTGIVPGDRVIMLTAGNWSERRLRRCY